MAVRIIVCGSREWKDRDAIDRELGELYQKHRSDLVIVHGACPKGADRLAESWCKAVGVTQERYPAEWHKHGRAAGPIRNLEMAQSEPKPELCLAFWDGASAGTKDMIRTAAREGIKVKRVRPWQ